MCRSVRRRDGSFEPGSEPAERRSDRKNAAEIRHEPRGPKLPPPARALLDGSAPPPRRRRVAPPPPLSSTIRNPCRWNPIGIVAPVEAKPITFHYDPAPYQGVSEGIEACSGEG